MSYALVIPGDKKIGNEVKVSGNLVNNNKLWSVNNGEMLLHSELSGFNFLREIGVDSVLNRVNYLVFSEEQMKTIFTFYVQQGELLTLTFKNDETEDYEVADFLRSFRYGSNLSNEETEKLAEDYEYMVNDLIGPVWYFTIIKNNLQVKIYENSIVSILERNDVNSEEIALSVYKEIFVLLNIPFSLSPIQILEKDKIKHPLKNAHVFVQELLLLSEEKAKEKLGLDESEVERIKNYLLENTKSFENKTRYVE